jgi:hypothetical protein
MKWLVLNTRALQLGAFIVLALSPARVLAERVTVIPKHGEARSGEIVERIQGSHILLRTDDGQRYRIKESQIAELKPAAAPATPDPAPTPTAAPARAKATPAPTPTAAPAPEPLPPLSDSVRAALVSGLMAERVEWQSRYTGLATPTVLILLGAAAIAGGIGLTVVEDDFSGCPNNGSSRDMTDWSRCNVHPYTALGAATIVVGGLSFLSGIGLMLHRTSDGHQRAELLRIDETLRRLGASTQIVPWLSTSARGPSGGFRAQLSF